MLVKDTNITLGVAAVQVKAQAPHQDAVFPPIEVRALLSGIGFDPVVPLHPEERRFSVALQIANLGGSAGVLRLRGTGKGKDIDQSKDMHLPLEEDIIMLQYLQSQTKSERWLTITMKVVGE